MIDQDTMTEYFSFAYSYEDDSGPLNTTVSRDYVGGVSLYEDGGVVDLFLQFLRGAGYSTEKLEEVLEDL